MVQFQKMFFVITIWYVFIQMQIIHSDHFRSLIMQIIHSITLTAKQVKTSNHVPFLVKFSYDFNKKAILIHSLVKYSILFRLIGIILNKNYQLKYQKRSKTMLMNLTHLYQIYHHFHLQKLFSTYQQIDQLFHHLFDKHSDQLLKLEYLIVQIYLLFY